MSEIIAGKYRLERELGAGGMGNVWIAVQEPLGRRVALKRIGGALDAEARARFEREARIVANLRCPHVVTLFDFGEHEGTPYIVLELCEGETLRAAISRGPLSIDAALAVARDVACGLRSAHEAGVIHRDLKPENVVLVPDKDRGRRAKLLDFGIAKDPNARDGATVAGMVAGTAGYIAPEVVARGASDDPRVDLYALGVVLFEMLAGGAPFEAPTPLALITAHATQPPPPVSTRRADAPPALASLVARLLEKDPTKRPPDADAVIAAIDALRTGVAPTQAPAPLDQLLGVSDSLRLPPQPSIAVQPFTTPGGSDDDVYFAEAISEDVLIALSRFKHLFVVARMTMVLEEARDTDPLRVGRTLGVRYVLQGTVRRSGDRIRVAVKLVDASTGSQLWAHRFDAPSGDVFDVQDQISQSIVSAIAGQVEAAQAAEARRRPPQGLAAYDWLARGRFHHHRRTVEDNVLSREALDRAVELDPDYAHAHAWRACAYGQAFALGGTFDPQRVGTALMTSLTRALALDDADAECHRMACELAFSMGDIVKAEHHHRRAMSLNPNDSRIVGQAGELEMYVGDLDQSVSLLTHAARLDPLLPKPFFRLLARARYVRGELDEAARIVRCLDEHDVPALAVAAAIGALRGEDVSDLAARGKPSGPGWTPAKVAQLFREPARRAAWLRGFEAAGVA
jgi:serine/threonine protein kinase/Flp pilus assembly protein TadD